VSRQQAIEEIGDVLGQYANLYRSVRPVNEVQRLVQEAAVAVSEQRWRDARRALLELRDRYLVDRQTYDNAITQVVRQIEDVIPSTLPQQPLALPGSVGGRTITVTSPIQSVNDVMPGDRVFSQRLGKSVEVVRANVKTITVRDADGKTYRLPPSDLRREQAVRRAEVVAPARPLIRRPPVEQEPVRLDPVQAERVMQQPEAVVADMVVNNRFEGLFAPLGDVMGDASSLPREELRLLPRNLREQLEGLDE